MLNKKFIYRVSRKSVYVFSNLNISTIIHAINSIFLCIVDKTFIFYPIKLQWNRPKIERDMNDFFEVVKKRKCAHEIQRPIKFLSIIWVHSIFLHEDKWVYSIEFLENSLLYIKVNQYIVEMGIHWLSISVINKYPIGLRWRTYISICGCAKTI